MSSKEPELGIIKQDEDKPATQRTEFIVESKDIPDSVQKDCGDAGKQIVDNLTTKPVEQKKMSDFEDDDNDDDEMQLRWDDDDEESNNGITNAKETVNQIEDDLALKDSFENPSTTLVSAVKELESAIIESKNKELGDFSSTKFTANDGTDKAKKITVEMETNSSKEILDNIDELIGMEESSEIKNDKENPKINCDSGLTSNKCDDQKAIGESEVSENNVDTPVYLTKDLDDDLTTKPTDSNALNVTTGSIDEKKVLSSTINDSFIDSDVKFEHGLKRPDVMLEIPTQEIIDCLDDFDDSDCEKDEDKDVTLDISKQINVLDGDMDSKIDDDIEFDDEVQIDKTCDLEVTKVSKNEDLCVNDVEMCDASEKINVALKPNESTKSTNEQFVIEDPELIGKDNIAEVLPKSIDTTTNKDKVKCITLETNLMDVDDIHMPGDELKSASNITVKKVEDDVYSNVNFQPSEVKEIPSEKIDEIVNLQVIEQNIVTQDKTENTCTEPQHTAIVEHIPDSIQETDIQISHENSEVRNKSENEDIVIASVSDETSDPAFSKDFKDSKESSVKIFIDSKPSSKSVLISETSTKIPKNFYPQKTETIKPILDKKDMESTNDPNLLENVESMNSKSTNLEENKPMSDKASNKDLPTKESETLEPTTDQSSTSMEVDESPKDPNSPDNVEPINSESANTGVIKSISNKESSKDVLPDLTSTAKEPDQSTKDSNSSENLESIHSETSNTEGTKAIHLPSKDIDSNSKEMGESPKNNSSSENMKSIIVQSIDTEEAKTTSEIESNKELPSKEAVILKMSELSTSDEQKDTKLSENVQSISESTKTEDTKPISDKESNRDLTSKGTENIELSTFTESTVDQSKGLDNSSDLVPDTTDEVPEGAEDSLGLLAESSRVMDDDEEDEEGDADDDEDFDLDDESSNQMTAEHSEDSSAQPDKEDGQTDKEDQILTTEEKQINFAVSNITTEKEAGDMEITTEETKVSHDVTTGDAAPAPVEANTDIGSDKETVAVDQHADVETVSVKETEAATNSILKELLMNQDVPVAKTTMSETVVELECSSSEDDIQEVSKPKECEVSTDVKKDDTKSTAQHDVKAEAETKNTEDEKVKTEQCKPDANVEVFNLDSDEDVAVAEEIPEKPESNKCINPYCPSGARASYVLADIAARAYFDANKKKKYRVCVACADAVAERSKGLVKGVKELTPLLELDLRKVSSETVEISDSDSDDGDAFVKPEALGESAVKYLEDNLADVINETWIKYKLDERLTDAQMELNKALEKLEADSKEIDTMLNECQVATDLLRNQLYATFEPERRELTAICIVDTPLEKKGLKRHSSSAVAEQPAKRAAIPLGYTPLDDDTKSSNLDAGNDDDKDVSVVKLSAEVAPSDLPPPGEIIRPRLSTGTAVFAMRNSFCTWVPSKIVESFPKNLANAFTMCRVKFEIKQKISTRMLSARCLAYFEPADVRLTIGTRVIALSKENVKLNEPNKTNNKSFYSGIVAEIPNPVNNYRYLIFFDHGYAQYVHHRDTRVVCESSTLVWEEVHPNSREFVKQYLIAYPERPMVRLHAGQRLKTEWNGKWWVTKVLQVDASLVEVAFEDDRTEWIYRGSTRLAPLFLELQAAERQRARPLPRSNQRRLNMPYVEYTRSEEQNKADALAAEQTRQQQQNEEMRRQRAVAKKSTALPIPPPSQTSQSNLDSVTSRVVYYTPKNAVKPYKMTPHTCSPKCKRTDVLALKDLRTYNPLAKPLLSGWERQVVRFKGHKEVMYRAPCGRRVRDVAELLRYLRCVRSDMPVDLFDFGASTHCLAEFVLNKCLVGKKDLSHGKENVPVPCVNYYDESLPEFCSYNTERTPTAGVPLNLDPEFLCGCDCTDDCQDKSKCACWKLTLEGARTIGLDNNVGYEYKRLPEPLPSGIYECNSRCKCKHTCLNRVAQHPLQLKLQVFKTMNRGWGIRALNDVPKGAFLCVYAGNLLTDATANLDGLNEGDEYLAELDYIEVVEQMKEGFEEDIPDADKKLDRKSSQSSSGEESSEEEETHAKDDEEDYDFQPGFIGLGIQEFSKRLRKRDRAKKKGEEKEKEKGKEIDKGMEDDGCITISDDEEAKEPTKFMAQSGIGAKEFVSKYKSVRALYGKDEACYIMDAKVQGNIGRYLNHSCTPNVFVQNVFVDTHDPRFPWVAFFALSHIRAGTELTWNYNYDVGSVPGKVLYCYCGAPNCRGRLL
ncbi:histone-lysine N-methyltransferase eggless isoform X2 [Plodia interpunctella]|uniref:histone-lysine N-methyltransferase eggless isoform X2 n=1 Tax=Plodia interpunctella TaxID=58824 RepID=UPI0023681E60|nr:histone-lysine N-methyltransferase eggless isoform X2 [Plodia interpunctella]